MHTRSTNREDCGYCWSGEYGEGDNVPGHNIFFPFPKVTRQQKRVQVGPRDLILGMYDVLVTKSPLIYFILHDQVLD